MPDVSAYRGLRGVAEIRTAAGQVEWHFFWSTEHAPRQHEARLTGSFGDPAPTQLAVYSAEVAQPAWWRRAPSWVLVSGLAAVATVSANIEEINTTLVKIRHEPEMALDRLETLQLASHSTESRFVRILGDPFFRVTLTDLAAEIVPDPNYPAPYVQPNSGRVSVQPVHRSADVSEIVELPLRFEGVSPGRYLLQLRGKVQSAWRSAPFEPAVDSIQLDVRAPLSVGKRRVTPWPPDGAIQGKYPEALVDFNLILGRPREESLNARIELPGDWIDWSVTESPPIALEKHSQNSVNRPKGVVFVLRNVPRREFSAQPVRVWLRALTPMPAEEWERRTAEIYTNFVD